ncbi:MAG: hypothetical protein VCA34_13745, partial [Roseibacillus sp.]
QEIWKARIDRIRRLQHYRLLAVAALEIETDAADPTALSPAGTATVQTALVKTPDNRFAVTSMAPDGTRFIWELSPQFARRRLAN